MTSSSYTVHRHPVNSCLSWGTDTIPRGNTSQNSNNGAGSTSLPQSPCQQMLSCEGVFYLQSSQHQSIKWQFPNYMSSFLLLSTKQHQNAAATVSINITREQHLMLWSYSYKSLARSSISSSRKSMSSRLTCGLITTWRKKLTLPLWGWYPSIMLPFFIILSLIIGATWK